MRERAIAVAAGVAISVSGALAKLTRKVVDNYFPLADEWPILAHSHPNTARPTTWFTEGFRNYFTPPNGLPNVGGADFIRPLFNATYWVAGRVARPDSGRYLHIAHVGVGACAGLTSLAVARTGGSLRAAAASGAAVPFMPALFPSGSLLVYPCMAFDPVAACFSQSAVMTYDSGRTHAAAGFLAAGLLTKETALPTAVALPALYALQSRGELLHSPLARRSLALLCTPAGLWFAARRAAFGARDNVYVLHDDPDGRLVRQARIAAKFPFWTNLAALRSPGWSTEKAVAGAQLVSNALVMGGSAVAMGSRLHAGQRPTADEASLLASYAFLNAVGTSPRYGVTLDMSLLTSLARWCSERSTPATRAVTVGLAIGAAVSSMLTAKEYPRLERNFLAYAEVGRKYVAALREFDAGSRVLVLNDPVTFWAPVKWMIRTLGITADVIKLADHPWASHYLGGITAPSTVDLQPPATPGGPWRFTQSEGLDILAAYPHLPSDEPVHIDYGDGITIDLEPHAADAPPQHDHRRWAAMSIMPGDVRRTHLLYYDPARGEFRAVTVD